MASTTITSELPPPRAEVFPWLRNIPVAPEYHPTTAEFQDPIAYIFKIEEEASKFGICKIVPPVAPNPKKTAISNFNRSLAERAALSSSYGPSASSKSLPTFTTRQQQIGFCPRKPRPVQKPVWQSGENYTFQQFETKAKSFEKTYLKKCKKKGSLSPLEIETLYWKATLDKPFSVEYANDMPGSAFAPIKNDGRRDAGDAVTLGETAWNMRGVSRAKGSLLRFMKEEIPGVTSPMVYVAMMFSWFAWHVEDHDFHSLNYLHMGAGKTWYGVPREAAVAFEEVVRVHGYGGEINPLVTFAVLGEKTTVMSPEIFLGEGVPCCRLVQNPGEFVVTFPRAYHTGFNHGFNCGEASNIATPKWLRVAKDAAIRRASINYPPMVSHFQLLYDLALTICSSQTSSRPRSSRLKDKKKGEGETLIKSLFVEDVVQKKEMLHHLGDGSSVVLLPPSSMDISVCSNLRVGSQLRVTPGMSFSCRTTGLMNSAKSSGTDDMMLDNIHRSRQAKGLISVKEKFALLCEQNRLSSSNEQNTGLTVNTKIKSGSIKHSDKLTDQRLFSCVTCGILSFDCVAIVKPQESAARYLMSAGSTVFDSEFTIVEGDAVKSMQNTSTGCKESIIPGDLYDVPVESSLDIQMDDRSSKAVLDIEEQKDASSALCLIASAYGNSSDSEDDSSELDFHHDTNKIDVTNCSSETKIEGQNFGLYVQDCHGEAAEGCRSLPSKIDCGDLAHLDVDFHVQNQCSATKSNNLEGSLGVSHPYYSPVALDSEKTKFSPAIGPIGNAAPLCREVDEDSSRMHVFCLEHAIEVEQQLRAIGGADIMLLCHPEYLKIEDEARSAAEELGMDQTWNEMTFRNVTKEDEVKIQSALDSDEALPANSDWAVKLGVNLFYSANLSRSPLYSKQMPYNSVIYDAFGRSSCGSQVGVTKRHGKEKKAVAGKWCGKIWMSNQVHPFLVLKEDHEDPNLKPEPEEILHTQQMEDKKLEKKLQRHCKMEITRDPAKYRRKRKLISERGQAKKVKYPSNKPYRRIPRSKQAKFADKRKDSVSNDSLDEYSDQQYREESRGKKAEIEIGNADSHDLSEKRFGKQYVRIRRFKRAESAGRESAISDSSEDDTVYQQGRKFSDKKNTVPHDLLEDISGWARKQVWVSKQIKCSEREGEISDGSIEQTGYAEQDDFDSDHSNEDKTLLHQHQHQHQVNFDGNQTKFAEMDDAFSDDFVEETNFQHDGLDNSFASENAYSDDDLENGNLLQRKMTIRTEQGTFTDEEDAPLYDSTEENSHRPHNRVLRSNQKKIMSPCNTNKEKKHMKQGALRLRKNGNSVENAELELEEGGPSTRLRKRSSKLLEEADTKLVENRTGKKKVKRNPTVKAQVGVKRGKTREEEGEYQCDIEGCTMSLNSKQELAAHKRNICAVKGCGKKFFSHKYLVQHRRVHVDDRPLKCPWKGCKMTFKWAWARTEHIRVHTGARPYVCADEGCGQTFRFVSDFSRHKRKTGHLGKQRG